MPYEPRRSLRDQATWLHQILDELHGRIYGHGGDDNDLLLMRDNTELLDRLARQAVIRVHPTRYPVEMIDGRTVKHMFQMTPQPMTRAERTIVQEFAAWPLDRPGGVLPLEIMSFTAPNGLVTTAEVLLALEVRQRRPARIMEQLTFSEQFISKPPHDENLLYAALESRALSSGAVLMLSFLAGEPVYHFTEFDREWPTDRFRFLAVPKLDD